MTSKDDRKFGTLYDILFSQEVKRSPLLNVTVNEFSPSILRVQYQVEIGL